MVKNRSDFYQKIPTLKNILKDIFLQDLKIIKRKKMLIRVLRIKKLSYFRMFLKSFEQFFIYF